jgi:purine-nucleoside phosphorylase
MKVEDWNITAKSVDNALGVARSMCKETPKAAVVLGSGVNVLVDVADPKVMPFEEVFGIAPTVAGHAGSLTVAHLNAQPGAPLVAILRGRYHLYEGHDWSVVTLPTRMIIEWGIPNLILTNAAGGLNTHFEVGDLMAITGYRDFLNPGYKETGLIPAVMAGAVDCRNELTDKVIAVGERLHKSDNAFKSLRQGTYSAMLGPCYETLAEIEMLRRLKSDAVGMSTVPELKTAHGSKTKAAAISVITNVWQDDKPIGGHEEVLEASHAASRRLDQLFKALLQEI